LELNTLCVYSLQNLENFSTVLNAAISRVITDNMLKVYEYIKCSNMCTSDDNSRRNSYSICAINTVSVLLQVTIENIIVHNYFFILLHIVARDLRQILASVMVCYVSQCFEENKCCINLILQCFKTSFIVYFSDRLVVCI
jgi:hypothetical protein